MNSRILKSILYIVIAGGALFGALFLHGPKSAPQIIAGEAFIPVSVADTQFLRERGLSATSSLPQGTGKLFIFEHPGTYGFWMKDMQYPIDIVWIDAGWKVLGVAAHVLPESYPEVVYPPSEVRYVLELNAGEASGDNFKPGALLDFKK